MTRLTQQWNDDHSAFQDQDQDLSGSDYVCVCVWADGVHPKVRLGRARSCILVLFPGERGAPDSESVSGGG